MALGRIVNCPHSSLKIDIYDLRARARTKHFFGLDSKRQSEGNLNFNFGDS
jgi:hypothetical protein